MIRVRAGEVTVTQVSQQNPDAAVAGCPAKQVGYVLMLVAGLSLLALICIPLDVWSLSEGKLTGIAILKPGINNAIWYLGGGCMLAMLVVSTVFWRKRLRWQYGVCLAMGLLVFPAVAVYRFTASLAPWVVCSTCRGPDGRDYTFMDSSFLQGQVLALGRVAVDGLLYRNLEILGDTNGDSPRSYVLLVRPTNKVRTTYGQLHFTDAGMLLGLRHDNRCYFAYDFMTKRFIGHGDVEKLSPFLLVDDDSRLYDVDVETLFKGPDAHPLGRPPRQALLAATTHGNQEVRRLAERLLAQDQSE